MLTAGEYDRRFGRFLSQDPTGDDSGDDNYYRYVENNPLRFTDLSGLVNAGDKKMPWEGTGSSCGGGNGGGGGGKIVMGGTAGLIGGFTIFQLFDRYGKPTLSKIEKSLSDAFKKMFGPKQTDPNSGDPIPENQ